MTGTQAEQVALLLRRMEESSLSSFRSVQKIAFAWVNEGRRGGCTPAACNASNEVAVQAFLEKRIRFSEIAVVVSEAMNRVGSESIRDMDDVIAADRAARAVAAEAATRLGEARMGATS